MKSSFRGRHAKWFACISLLAITGVVLPLSGRHTAALENSPQNDFKPTTVFLVRHAERADSPREDPPLLDAGIARSQQLARILANAGVKAIYTSQYLRTRQTAEPLAKQLGIEAAAVQIKMSASNPRQVSAESINEIVEKIYQRAGENALVIGHNNTTPEVIRALGGDMVPTIDEKTFDDLFVVTVLAKGKARVTHLKY